jgi:hypothetical protein
VETEWRCSVFGSLKPILKGRVVVVEVGDVHVRSDLDGMLGGLRERSAQLGKLRIRGLRVLHLDLDSIGTPETS